MTRQAYIPKVYQPPGTEHLLEHKRCALWAGMGTGKTSMALTALDALYTCGETHPTLVLGPLRVARNVWSTEVAKWEHLGDLEVTPIIGTVKERLAAMRRDTPVYTTNYENLEWLITHWGDRWPYSTVLADESTHLKSLRLSVQEEQTRTAKKRDGSAGRTYTVKEHIRGQGGKRSKALGLIAHTHIDRFWEFTGTPSPNGLVDLWGQAWFLDAGKRLGRTFDAFKTRWFQASRDGYGSEPLPFAMDQIKAALADICLTIEGKDYFDLKTPAMNNVYVDLPPKVRKQYQAMETEMFLQLDTHSAEVFAAAARTQKLLQIANGAVYVDPNADDDSDPRAKVWKEVHTEKLQALDSLISELNGFPLLVVYEFRSDLARLLKAFPQGRHLKTQQDEDDFKSGKLPILFLHGKSGGHGIDGFQFVCSEICFFGLNWSLELYQQVIERIGPMRQFQAGFDRHITIHRIVARGTVDEDVIERVESKRSVQAVLLDAMKRRR